ncbi:MAG: prolyl oligopeptidase family serine peptidase [Nitrospira sp.]|nr:prolyl oligopeptidase family serine peptidase [Nitrospira sp.]HMV58811.1 prolyl oligopeptidase family serine peptidase [Nitrospira sp.]HMW88267.1 prolyl oligopeptidase family serine peptidase [Nitrospira sp.]HNA46649.1 prolyl oligopeptidase family serine peptidase [Nitrospira sp.]HNJ20684.1 prolyl oligopeptidase family serine peptidase [Nitrospira sp.]
MPAIYGLVTVLLLVWSMVPVYAEPGSTSPPTATFASLPRIESIQLSPSGRHLAVLRHHDGQTFLETHTVTGQDAHPVVSTDNREYIITWFRWINDERLLVSMRFAATPEATDTVETRLMAVNRDGTEQTANLLKQGGFSSLFGQKHVPQFEYQLVGMIPGDPRHVLLALDLEHPNAPDVYKVDVYSGERQLVQANPSSKPDRNAISHWIADRTGAVRSGVGQFQTAVHAIVRQPESTLWRELADYDLAKETGLVPLAFDADPAWLYVRDQHRGKTAIFKLNVMDRAADRVLVVADPKFDLNGELVYAPGRKKVVGVRYSAADERVLFWDFDAQRLQARIDRAIPGTVNVIHSSSDDGRLHVVKSSGAAQPPRWSIFDEQDGRMVLLGRSYPDLETAALAAPTTTYVTARDGKELQVFLTVPKDRDPRHLPMIVFPHGGPAARMPGAFNYWTQWFVSRGWAVLEPRFRGTEGYGDDVLRAGFQRWGLEMQNDLTDVVQYAVRAGIANAGRICIVGSGYGGYAALMGVVKTPDLYRCAVSLGGVTDLPQLVSDGRGYLNQKPMVEARIGSWWNDRDRLRETSPVAHAQGMRTPLLLMHGSMDRSVPVSQSRNLADALKAANATNARYVELPLADEALRREEDRLHVFSEMERFLTQHLD